jgi:hypothetical protein
MLHWGQGTTFKALAHLLSKVDIQEKRTLRGDKTRCASGDVEPGHLIPR